MGTAPFAVGFLEDLVHDGYNVVAVVTAPDRPAGRGKKLTPSVVKEKALELSLPILQPERLSDPAFQAELAALKPDLGIVIAFRMLPESVWALPRLGTVNVHGSLLPRWRGAAPIQHALWAGDSVTGVTLFQLVHALDEGGILAQRSTRITPQDNFESLHDRLAELGREMLRTALPRIAEGQLTPIPQDNTCNTPYARKIDRVMCRIDWEQPASRIHNQIRALSPTPGAWTTRLENGSEMSYKLFASEVLQEVTSATPGEIIRTSPQLVVACGEGALAITLLQAPGKRRLDAATFLRGTSIVVGDRFV